MGDFNSCIGSKVDEREKMADALVELLSPGTGKQFLEIFNFSTRCIHVLQLLLRTWARTEKEVINCRQRRTASH